MKKRNLIIGAVVVALIVLLVVVVICATANNPRKSTEEMFKALKEGNFDKVNEYTDYNEIMGEDTLSDETEEDKEMQKLFYNGLEWKILKSTENGNTATVEVEVTNKNFKTIMTNYVQQVFKMAFSGQEINNDEIEKYLIEELKKEDVEKSTSTQVINLNKVDGKWKVNVDENLRNAVLPGLLETMNSLGGIMNQ